MRDHQLWAPTPDFRLGCLGVSGVGGAGGGCIALLTRAGAAPQHGTSMEA